MSLLLATFRVPDVRNKVLFTLGLIILFRIGSLVPTPGVNTNAVNECLTVVADSSLYGMLNMFSGGALLKLSVFALGIMPYITASIILQLLTVVIPRLETLKKEGAAGQEKITQYTRYLTVALAILQATTFITLARTPGQLFSGCSRELLTDTSVPTLTVMILTMVAGTVIVMWFGELITAKGIGNGMSLLIFISIIASMPGEFAAIWASNGPVVFGLTVLITAVTVAAVVFVELGQRRIPVQYSKRMVGSRAFGGSSSYIPLKVNMAGVIPVIFASSLLYIPQLIVTLTGSQSEWAQWISRNFATGNEPLYVLTFVFLIVFFAFFYISITFNPVEVSDNLAKSGGFIPGIRPGGPTAQYLDYVLTRLTVPGSLYLALLAVLPLVTFASLGVGQRFLFGGASILIVVGVGLDTVKQLNSRLHEHNYEGFLK